MNRDLRTSSLLHFNYRFLIQTEIREKYFSRHTGAVIITTINPFSTLWSNKHVNGITTCSMLFGNVKFLSGYRKLRIFGVNVEPFLHGLSLTNTGSQFEVLEVLSVLMLLLLSLTERVHLSKKESLGSGIGALHI